MQVDCEICLIFSLLTARNLYRVADKKRPQLCNDVVLLNNRIQTKRNNLFKEQLRNYDIIHFCVNSEICKRVLGVQNAQNSQ